MAYDPKLGYDPNKDYSLAIVNAGSDEERERLRQERQQKINGQYGGKDPYRGTRDIMGTRQGTSLGGGTGTVSAPSGSGGGWTPSAGYTENITADAGLSDAELAQIQQYREQAKAGLISWSQANQMANTIRSRYGYTADKTGAATPTQQDPYGSFADYLASMGYGDYAEQTRAAIQASVEAAIQKYNDQIAQTEQDSGKLARQAYVAKMMGQKNLDQQLAAEGYAGGMADSQRIQTELDYQNQLSEIEQQRLLTVRELESAITQAQLSGDLQTAQELAAYLQQVQGQWADYLSQRQQMDNSNYWNRQQMDEQTRASAYERVMNLLSAGITPDSATLTAAGISAQEAAQILRYYGGGSAAGGGTASGGTSSGASGGGTSSGGRNTTYRGGGGYSNGSLSTAQIQQLQRFLGVTPDGKWGAKSSAAAGGLDADAAWTRYQGQIGSDFASTVLRNMKSSVAQNGGITENQRQQLWRYVSNGMLSEAELSGILDALGV